MFKKLFFSIIFTVVLMGVSNAQETFSQLAFLEQHVSNDNQFGPDQTEDQIGVHVRDINTRRRVGLFSFDISSIKSPGSSFANVSLSNLGAGVGPINVYGVIEELDNLPPRLELTWNNAPGVQNSPPPPINTEVVLDYNDLTPLLLNFTSPGNQVRESTESSQALADFINSDTDGIVTLLFAPNPGSSAILRAVRSEDGGIIGGTYLQGDILAPAEFASNPQPANEAEDLLRDDIILSWKPGEFAITHDLFLGTNLDDVNNATIANPLTAIAIEGLDVNNYDPGRLELGMTYYWRIDEVDASHNYKGYIWSFTVEPLSLAIPGEDIIATASSNDEGKGPENTINNSGLDESGLLHSNEGETMWLSSLADVNNAWIEFEFDKLYKLHEMWVWNSNEDLESLVGLGFENVTIEYSVDGVDFMSLGTSHEFARAPGEPNYAHNTIIDFNSVVAQYIRLTANNNWGEGLLNQYGLSEVRFFYIPVRAREPYPENGATDVAVDETLSWRSGREADVHDVYLSTDEQTVIDGTANVETVNQASYSTSFDLNQTYYWRVDEVNDIETPDIWEGEVWSFSTPENIVVDNFETSYDDSDVNAVWATWIDGYGVDENGSQIGNDSVPFLSTTNHNGGHSSPMSYDNTTASFSEVTAQTVNLPIGTSDWSIGSPTTLVIWIYGDSGNNPATDRLYAKIGNAKVLFTGDISKPRWMQFNIDLSTSGINKSNVPSITIGVEKIGATGGTGTVLIDDLRLYRIAPALPLEEIWIEAEDAVSILPDFEIFTELEGASGGQYVGKANGTGNVLTPPADSNMATYTFTVSGGVYEFDFRVYGYGGSNSFWLQIPELTDPNSIKTVNGTTVNQNNGWINTNNMNGAANWHWDIVLSADTGNQDVEWYLPAGTYTLKVACREDGFMLDAFVVSKVRDL